MEKTYGMEFFKLHNTDFGDSEQHSVCVTTMFSCHVGGSCFYLKQRFLSQYQNKVLTVHARFLGDQWLAFLNPAIKRWRHLPNLRSVYSKDFVPYQVFDRVYFTTLPFEVCISILHVFPAPSAWENEKPKWLVAKRVQTPPFGKVSLFLDLIFLADRIDNLF
jgi:hypothetical protein